MTERNDFDALLAELGPMAKAMAPDGDDKVRNQSHDCDFSLFAFGMSTAVSLQQIYGIRPSCKPSPKAPSHERHGK